MPGCNSVWSDGTCWANTITNPPSLTPPVDGEFVGISPTTTVTLDQDAHPSTLDVFGTMNQAGNSLTADNVVVAPAGGSAAVYNLSGGTLTINGGNTFNLDVGGTFNQSGGTLTATKGISLDTIPFSGRTGIYNLTAGNLSAVGLVIGNGSGPLGINAGIFNQSGGAASFTGPVILGGPLDPAPVAGGIGTLTISDGTFDVASSVGFGMVVGGTGTGTVTQSGGTVTIKSGPTMGGLEIGRSVGGSGSYTISAGELNVDRESLGSSAYMLVGNAGTGAFSQTGGAVSVEGTLTLGFSAGGSGTYDLSGGGSTLDAEHIVIRNGTFTQSDGTVTVDTGSVGPGGTLSIFANGAYSLSAGTTNSSVLDVEDAEIIQGGIFTQSGGTNTAGGALTISNGGQYFLGGIGSQLKVGDDSTVTNASITQTGGSAQFNGALTLDGTGTGVGNYSLGGLGNLAVAGEEVIGDSGIGTFTQTAGTHSPSGTLTLGHSNTGDGTYQLSGGTLAAGGDVVVGDSGKGQFTQTGGAANIAGTLTLGAAAGGNGTWTLSNGNLTVTQDVVIAGAGTGTFIQSGGTHTIDGNLSISALAGSTGSYTLSDGTLQVAGDERVGLVAGAAPGSASFTHSGGVNQIAGTLIVGAGGGGLYTQSGGSLVAKDEIIGGLGTGKGVFTQTAGVNTVSHVLTIGSGSGTSGTYNLAGGIINAGNPKIQGLVNNDTLNITGVSQISGNILNNATGTIKATGAILNVLGTVTNFGTINIDPSSVTVQNLNVGASGVLIAGAGNVLSVTGNFINNSLQNTLWNTAAAELDFTGGGTHIFALAGQSGNGFANNFSWGTIDLGATDVLDLTSGSGNALYFKMLEGLDITGNVINNIIGANGLFLYYDAATDPFLHGNYLLQGGGMLIAIASGSNPNPVPEPESIALLFMGLSVSTAVGLRARRRRTRRPQSDGA
ncbi:MAG TPA: PEP-CTERM sorting domain-containing protein [Micropepsaceae bacterium]|nr:PEP-CTERM sorting domain-containing protein [Micropepsaceae bacterium]